MRISCCVITLNEEANLARCLHSCAEWVDEIVVLDSGSTDATARVAGEFGARWHVQEWLGYVGQKNRLLDLATHDWVLSLDADEALSTPLREELLELKRTDPPPAVAGFSMPRCVRYEGRWIRHGDWYPDRLTRLFRRRRARFVGGKVHERLQLDGITVPLTGDLHHYSFRSRADHWDRCVLYARLWAEWQYEAGRKTSAWAPWAHAAFRWARGYLLRRGFLDGRQGWHIALMNMREVYWKYRRLRQLNRARDP